MPGRRMCWRWRPDVVFVATGGMPDTEVLEEGNELVVSSWDVVGGRRSAGRAGFGV